MEQVKHCLLRPQNTLHTDFLPQNLEQICRFSNNIPFLILDFEVTKSLLKLLKLGKTNYKEWLQLHVQPNNAVQ